MTQTIYRGTTVSSASERDTNSTATSTRRDFDTFLGENPIRKSFYLIVAVLVIMSLSLIANPVYYPITTINVPNTEATTTSSVHANQSHTSPTVTAITSEIDHSPSTHLNSHQGQLSEGKDYEYSDDYPEEGSG